MEIWQKSAQHVQLQESDSNYALPLPKDPVDITFYARLCSVADIVWIGCGALTHDALPNRLTKGLMYIFGPAEQPKARRGLLVEMKKPMYITSGLHLHDLM